MYIGVDDDDSPLYHWSPCIGAIDKIDACRMEGYVVHNAVTNTHVQLPYPSDVGGAIINGYAFHHGRFVMGLRKLARDQNRYVQCMCVVL